MILMAKDWKYDDNGDLVLENGHPVWIYGVEELAQALRSLLSMPKGGFIGDEDLGLDMSFITDGKFDEQAGINAVKETLMQDKRVIEIQNIEVQIDKENGVAVFLISLSSTVGDINFAKEVQLDATD